MHDYIVTEEVSVGYQKKHLIKHINLHIKKGEILTLIGPNGVGKSTILKSIIRQLQLICGTVYMEGEDMSTIAAKELAKKLAIVMTDRIHPDRYTCYDVVASGRYPYTGKLGILQEEDKRIIYEAMENVDILDFEQTDFNEISDGQRQRVMLARAICQEPEILVLDEPTSYLDIRYKVEFLWMLRNLVQQKNIAVVMSLHEIDLAQKISDRIVCVKEHAIDKVGRPEEIMTSEYIRELYGMQTGGYLADFGSVEFPKAQGHPDIFVIGGGGSGIPIYRMLQKQGKSCYAGILTKADIEYPVAARLCEQVLTVDAFSMPDETDMEHARKIIDTCKIVYCANLRFDVCNLYNQELYFYAKKQNKLKNFDISL